MDHKLKEKGGLFVFSSEGELADFFISRWRENSSRSIRERGKFTAALSGGKSPVEIYSRLSRAGGLDWGRTFIFQVDERLVPRTSADSNFNMIKSTLLNRIRIPAGNVFPVPVEESTPQLAAERYEAEIKSFFGLRPGEFPVFDLISLGIGEDGHTASLFPGSPALDEKEHIVAAVHPGGGMHDRITLTLPVLNRAREVIFAVKGKEKAHIFKKVVDGDRNCPAALVVPDGELLFVADMEAAALISMEKA